VLASETTCVISLLGDVGATWPLAERAQLAERVRRIIGEAGE
jgi:hypothetical protein